VSARRRTLGASVLAAVLAACGGGGHRIPRDCVTSPGEALFNGYTRPEIRCFGCHDGTAHGTSRGPDLATRVPTLTDEQIASTIRTGKHRMPSFAGKLSDAEIAELVTWLRGTFGPARS